MPHFYRWDSGAHGVHLTMSYLSWPSTVLVEMKRIRKSEPLYFFSHLYWNKISHIQHCVRLRRTTWWFNICIYCEIITTVRLVSTSINLQIRFLCVRTKIYSLSNFKVYNKVLLAIVTMLYIISPERFHLIATAVLYSTWLPFLVYFISKKNGEK